ncbi:hypothetical protein C1645_840816, partial [Glomus cerebriforme]
MDRRKCKKCPTLRTWEGGWWCKPCQINYLKENFINRRASGNEKIDDFIQEMQLKIDSPYDRVFEWIPYNQVNEIDKVISKSDFAIVYSAKWKGGPLFWNWIESEYSRGTSKKVVLKCLDSSLHTTDEFLDKVKAYTVEKLNLITPKIYGISQNPVTKDYIMVLNNNYFETYCVVCDKIFTKIVHKWCKPCQINYLKENFISGNEKIDNFIQEMQTKIESPLDRIFEWIPYNQFNEIEKVVSKSDSAIAYSAKWKDGPLFWNQYKLKYSRGSSEKVVLKCMDNSLHTTDEFLDKVKPYTVVELNFITPKIYGISQNPDTKDYIMVLNNDYDEKCCALCDKIFKDSYKWCKPCQINYLKVNFTNWTSENEEIDNFIQGMQLKIIYPTDLIFEWIPYNQFSNIKIIGAGDFVKLYLAKWKNGPLYWDEENNIYIRKFDKNVALICLYYYSTNIFLNKVKEHLINNNFEIYGITQNPKTKDYILVIQNEYYMEYGKMYCGNCSQNILMQNT